jgi:L-asparaginase
VADGTIVVLGTGGTIAGAAPDAADNLGYRAGQIGVERLVDAVPALRALPLECEQVGQVDSKDMDVSLWVELARACRRHLARPGVAGLVVTHGTDTLEETAWFLQSVLAPRQPVVLTCAMRPATALAPDGPQNLLDAVCAARDPRMAGVVAVCAGEVHAAAEVAKIHPYRLDAFSSGEGGPLALVEEQQLRWLRDPPAAGGVPAAAGPIDAASWPWVEIVTSHAASDRRAVDALVAQGVRGLVVACTGNGTIHHSLEAALHDAQAQGVAVVRTTRCPLGQIVPRAGEAFARSALPAVKARISLALSLLGQA